MNVFDLFCGAGGFSLGAHYAGFEIAAAVEYDRHACATYRRNLIDRLGCKIQLIEDDIGNVGVSALSQVGGTCDLLLGGPPCQGFSTHRLKGAGIEDPRNRLLLRYFEFVDRLRPKIFLVENVPGLLWPRHATYLDAFIRAAKDARYSVCPPVICNAQDFGVPQRRKRVFILGMDSSLDLRVENFPPPSSYGPDHRKDHRPAGPAFAPAPVNDPNDIHMRHGPELTAVFESTPPNGGSRRESSRILACHETHDGHKDVYGRIDPSAPAPTMTTACINPSKGRFVHPTEPHGITVRQAARLQSFPDWFVFEGGLTAAGQQIGNAVPPLLARELLRPLRDILTAASTQEAPSSRENEAPPSAARRRNMARVRGKDTKPERMVRSAAHKMGLRFRLHRSDLPGRPDIVFPKHRLAVFVHGCFWHRHSGCRRASTPSVRQDFWNAKFEANVARDRAALEALAETGWKTLVLWECETKSSETIRARLHEAINSAK